jgi:hypothetical protein
MIGHVFLGIAGVGPDRSGRPRPLGVWTGRAMRTPHRLASQHGAHAEATGAEEVRRRDLPERRHRAPCAPVGADLSARVKPANQRGTSALLASRSCAGMRCAAPSEKPAGEAQRGLPRPPGGPGRRSFSPPSASSPGRRGCPACLAEDSATSTAPRQARRGRDRDSRFPPPTPRPAWQRGRARALGVAHGHTGSVSFIHRCGSAPNSHVHCHCILPDGLFVPVAEDTSASLRFVPLPPPTTTEVEELTHQPGIAPSGGTADRAGTPCSGAKGARSVLSRLAISLWGQGPGLWPRSLAMLRSGCSEWGLRRPRLTRSLISSDPVPQ